LYKPLTQDEIDELLEKLKLLQPEELDDLLEKIKPVENSYDVAELINSFLKKNKELYLIFEYDEETDGVKMGVRKRYSKKTMETVEQAKKEYADKKKVGYDKKNALKEAREIQRELQMLSRINDLINDF
jgi:cell fate (sporulation/competence/biofilm development) regulator YlbF (YheA/YmcA/DUF963 family)